MARFRIKCRNFSDFYQSAKVPAGEYKRVFDLHVTGGYVAFIERKAHTWFSNTYYEFIVDGELVEKIEYEVPVNAPRTINPPIVAEKRIEWWAYNNDSSEHLFEVICDGRLCKLVKI